MDDIDYLQSDIEHVTKFINGFESIILKFQQAELNNLTGVENYALGVYKASGLRFSQHMGSENFIVQGAKKLYEIIANFCRAIFDFLRGKRKVDVNKETAAEIGKELNGLNKYKSSMNKDSVIEVAPLDDNAYSDIITETDHVIDKAKKSIPVSLNNIHDIRQYCDSKIIIAIANKAKTENYQSKYGDKLKSLGKLSDVIKKELRNVDHNGSTDIVIKQALINLTNINNKYGNLFISNLTSFKSILKENPNLSLDSFRRVAADEYIDAMEQSMKREKTFLFDILLRNSDLIDLKGQLEKLTKDLDKEKEELKKDNSPNNVKLFTVRLRLLKALLAANTAVSEYLDKALDITIQAEVKMGLMKLELVVRCIRSALKEKD